MRDKIVNFMLDLLLKNFLHLEHCCFLLLTTFLLFSLIICRMKEIGISPEDKVLCFGQLLGMCDYITFPLGQYTQTPFPLFLK